MDWYISRAGTITCIADARSDFARRRRLRRAKRVAKAALLFLATVLVGVLGSLYFVPHPSAPPPVVASNNFRICGWLNRVNCVIDGDTIYHNRVKIRLADIDTPEISKPKCPYEAELGHKAKRRLLELVNAGPIDVVQTRGPDVDQYGRKLRVIMQNGHSLGDILVAEGLARRWNGARRPWC